MFDTHNCLISIETLHHSFRHVVKYATNEYGLGLEK